MPGIRKLTLALSALCLATACSGAEGKPTTAPTATVTATVTATETVTVEPEPAPIDGPLKFGQTAEYDWGKVTALKVDQSVAADDSLPGSMAWMGVLVKTCVTAQIDGKPVVLGWGAWTVADRTDGQYEAFPWTGVSYPQPTYPIDRKIPVGQCVRGWIVFNKPAGVRPVSATYGPSGGDPVVWEF